MKTCEDLTLAGLVHDLNNVFQTLVDAADLLSDDPRWAVLAPAILRSVELGKNIAISIQERGCASVPFEQVLGHATAFVEDSLIAGRGPAIRFECDIEPGIQLEGKWDWERVFVNLFLNSKRAMPQGGRIHVGARRVQGQIEIVVSDDGEGIPPEILDDLFQPHFSRNHSSGMGLHIVETIVREHGGSVQAANRVNGRGAEFMITVPAVGDPALQAKPAHAR